MANKIKYGLKNVYYAVATIASNGSATYATPVAFPGAISLSLEPSGESSPFYADNVAYWTGAANDGYEGDLEMAMITDSFKSDILGYVKDTKDVMFEDKSATGVPFALLFQFEGDDAATKHIMYNCTAARANTGGETVGESIEPQSETLSLTVSSIYNSDLDTDIVKAEANGDSDATVYAGWFSAVYQPTV